MGFGLLFLGYFTVAFMSWHTFGAVVQLFGYGLILWATLKLREYHGTFGLGAIGAALMLIVTAFSAVGEVSDFLYENLIIASRLYSSAVWSVIGYVDTAAFFVFHALLLWGVRVIAREVGVMRLEANAIRNFVFFFLYELLTVSATLPIAFFENMVSYLMLFSIVLYFICSVLNLILFASCYAQICDESDVEMTRKPSRFAFVNRMRENAERREQKNFESGQAYRAKREEKKKRKGKKV